MGRLVINRKAGQTIVVGGSVSITVDKIKGGRVKLICTGPLEIPIHRKEVQDVIDFGYNQPTIPLEENKNAG